MTTMKYCGLLLALFLVVVGLVACSEEKAKSQPSKPPVPVKVDKATSRDVPVTLRTVGTVEAQATVELRARVSGQLLQVHFQEGVDVRKGALLFTIDPASFQVALRRAEAQLGRQQAMAATAREKERRYAVLVNEGLISHQDYDLLRAEADALEAAAAADRASVEDARLQLSWSRITAPIAGRTGSLLAHAGDLISANGTQPLLVIHQVEPIDVSFTLPERELPRLRQALAAGTLPVQAIPEGATAASEAGSLTFIDNAVDTATGTIRLKATFTNLERSLWPGQFVTVSITLDTLKNTTVVPGAAVQTGQQGTFVFVAKEDGSAEMRPVKAGITFENVTVINEGISPGGWRQRRSAAHPGPGHRRRPAYLTAADPLHHPGDLLLHGPDAGLDSKKGAAQATTFHARHMKKVGPPRWRAKGQCISCHYRYW